MDERLEFDVSNVNSGLNVFLKDEINSYQAKEMVPCDLSVLVDETLLFWEHHFDGLEFAKMPNGHEKGGTIRFRDGYIRIPAANKLKVYETKDFEDGKPYRGVIEIPKVVILPFCLLNNEELLKDGFDNINHAYSGMREYYSTLLSEGVVSYYYFGKYTVNKENK